MIKNFMKLFQILHIKKLNILKFLIKDIAQSLLI